MKIKKQGIPQLKRRVIIPIFLISILLLTSCSPELIPQALASATQDIVSEVKEDNDDVFAEIQRNIDLVTELKEKVQEAQMNNELTSLPIIIRHIETVTQSYERLAEQRDSIRTSILQKAARIENMQVTVDAEIRRLREKKVAYTEELRHIGDHNPIIATAQREALTKAIGYVDAQIRLWREFNNIEWDILIEMSDIQKTIDGFLAMIESTAIVFREGLNLLYLQRDIDEAIALFASDIPRMEQLTQDMERSWSNLDYLLETLTGIANIGISQ